MPLTAWLWTLVRPPAASFWKLSETLVATARPRTLSPRKARRSKESTRRSVQEEWVSACRRRSSGSSATRPERAATAESCSVAKGSGRRVLEHEADGVADRLDVGRLLLADRHPIVVLELHHQLVEVERVGVEVLLEAGPLVDPPDVDLELLGEVLAHQGEDFLARHLPELFITAT